MKQPKLRFKADDGNRYPEWEEKRLEEVAVRITRKNKDNCTDIPLTISSLDGLIDQRDFFNKIVASKDMSGYYLLKRGEFAYNKSYSNGFDFGSIKRLNLYDEGALSTLYICFALNDNEDSDFYQKYFDSLSWYPELQKICAEGARNHGLLNVSTNDFFQLKLHVPKSKEEQQEIASLFTELDNLIQSAQKELDGYRELKQGMLQKMFPKKGEKVPEIRFLADDGSQFPEWEEKKIDDIATCFAGATPSTKIPEYWKDGTIRWMSSGEVNNGQIHDTEKRISQLGFDKCSTKMVKPNTVVMALAGQGKTRGMVAITRVPLCTNQSLCAIETNDDICDDYLYQYLQIQYNNLRLISSGDGTRGGLNLKLIGGYIVSAPCLEEQKKIGEYFQNLDNLIASQEQELDGYKELKKGLLQQMFC